MSDPTEDFSAESSILRDARPTLTAFELDRVKLRICRGAGRAPRSGSRYFIRTRGAVVAAIAAGSLMSTGGTALAISGLASSGGAATAQYGGTGAGTGAAPGSGDVQGANGGGKPKNAVSPAEQAQQQPANSSGKLPFTGFLAIPMLLIGLGLVIAGLVGRRSFGRLDGGSPGH